MNPNIFAQRSGQGQQSLPLTFVYDKLFVNAPFFEVDRPLLSPGLHGYALINIDLVFMPHE
jgi:hypothetical protein